MASQMKRKTITTPLAHQARYKLNPNYARVIKQNINKLLTIGFIEYVEEGSCCHP
jgi:hypothetical protein